MKTVKIIRHGEVKAKDIVYIVHAFEPIFKLKKGYENLGNVDNVDFDRFNLDFMFWDETPEQKRYFNYGKRMLVSYPYTSAKESFMSLAKSQNVEIEKNNLFIVKEKTS